MLITIFILLEVPDSPKFYSNSPTSTSIFVNWSTPMDRNDPIVRYSLSCQNANILTNIVYFVTTDTTYNITGLTAFVNYIINVSAINSIGTSESDSIEVQTKEAGSLLVGLILLFFSHILVVNINLLSIAKLF